MKKGRDMKAVGQRGFTLIELMITVAIVAILAAIAYPSYTQYVIRGHRAAAQAEMMDIANRQQQFFLANRVYASSLADLGIRCLPTLIRGTP
jgi:type IV pilus assembly protein PilE